MIDKPSKSERIFTGTFHAILVPAGIYEMIRAKHKFHKFLAFGYAMWHLDAAIADYSGDECVLKTALRKITGNNG